MYDEIEEKTVILPPFKHFIMTVGEIPTSYLETMTYYEMLVWFTNYLGKTVIPAINENGEAVTELQHLFVKLQNYVNDYFDNLDVQEEINNKLDDMVEAGTLQEIIAEYLNSKALFGFDTVADMKVATNLIDGSYAKTLGYNSKNDGGSSLYKIRQITNDDVVDNATIIEMSDTSNELIAELIVINDTINVKQFGAYGDYEHNDSTTIQNAINYCIANNKKLFIDNNKYLIKTGLTINNTLILDINGTLSTDEEINLITLTSDNSIININNLENTSENLEGNGILLKGKNYNNTININSIQGFNKGIALIPETNGVQYTKTNFQLLNNQYDIYFKADNSSWCNQNYFVGGRCQGTYGIYIAQGESQANFYDGNNFYNIGFEDNYDAITLNNCTLNTFKDFRMMESIENYCFNLSANCNKNLFSSRTTAFCLFDKIHDENNTFKKCNTYDMFIQNSGYTVGSSLLRIYKTLPIIETFVYDDDNRKYLGDGETYSTSSEPFKRIKMFRIDLPKSITINLDERYDYSYLPYNEFYVSINSRDGDRNLIINDSASNQIFNLSTISGTTGSYQGLFKITRIADTGSKKWSILKVE